MIERLINVVSSSECIGVTVQSIGCDCGFFVNVDDVEYSGDVLRFGDDDQDVCIKGLSKCKIKQDVDEYTIVGEDKKNSVILCVVR